MLRFVLYVVYVLYICYIFQRTLIEFKKKTKYSAGVIQEGDHKGIKCQKSSFSFIFI